MNENWEEHKQNVLACRACALCETRTQVVFGVGDASSPVVFIGEAPGQQEDEKGEPFVGRSGQLLDKMLAAVDLSREKNIYITNIVKCRPPNNRDPLPAETATCMNHLRAQIKAMAPKIIVCLGRISAMRIIKDDFKVTREHGEWTKRGGIHMMGTFHPAALLRNPNNKPAAFEDYLALRRKILEICPEVYEK